MDSSNVTNGSSEDQSQAQTPSAQSGTPAPTAEQPSQPPQPRPARSKNGCLTCRRRKVRCDEQRPRCSHCERLNLQCKWRPPYNPSTQWRFVGPEPSQFPTANNAPSQAPGRLPPQQQPLPEETRGSPGDTLWSQNPGAVDQLFDFASFMWDAGPDIAGHYSPETGSGDVSYDGEWMDPWSSVNSQPLSTIGTDASSSSYSIPRHPSRPTQARQLSAPRPGRPNIQMMPVQAEDHELLNYFVRTVVPPILAEVETQKRWSSMRQMLMSMSNGSPMVKNAILAFSILLYNRREAPGVVCPQHYYEAALSKLVATGDISSISSNTGLREHLLATLFFLSYVDILEDRMDSALEHLKRAYQLFQQGNRRGFRPVERRLLSWIRLLDARTVSAGGDGLFLSDNSEALIVHPSPGSVDEGQNDGGARDEVKDWDIEDALFQVLYQPGIVFFQKVQSFMGRISMIDPWHRSRGTVQDEMEVMQIASQILKDLSDLYDDRPTLMDHAVDGRLTAPHVSQQLAVAITRAFRTYLSNYHASKVHLHRVAYKHLPLSRDTQEALNHIRHLTRLMVDSAEPDAALPVSQLWPLLMLGSEEQDPVERVWIKEQILRMEKVATNASITAQVLEEVQARQDAGKSRVDIRAVMHAVFDSCFAIV